MEGVLTLNLKRTDLALETHEMLLETAEEISGVIKNETEKDGVKVSHIEIKTDDAQKMMNKPKGNYFTIELPDLTQTLSEDNNKISHVIKDNLLKILKLDDNSKILVIGLGNRFITPDALGPLVVSNLVVTRHLFNYIPESIDEGLRCVSAIAPGVLGLTGIESAEIVKGITEKVKPDVLIVIDALAARSVNRIVRTVQIADTGINPGAGVGNNRKELSEKTLGVPVIAIGVPTVVDAVTITSDTLDSVKENIDSPIGKIGSISYMDEGERYNTIKSAVDEDLKGLIVTPKDIDALTDKMSKIIANGINIALHDNMTIEDTEMFLL